MISKHSTFPGGKHLRVLAKTICGRSSSSFEPADGLSTKSVTQFVDAPAEVQTIFGLVFIIKTHYTSLHFFLVS